MKEILGSGYRPFTPSELYALLKRYVLVFPKGHVEKRFGYAIISIEIEPVYSFVKVTLKSVGICGHVPEETSVYSEDLVDKWCFGDGTPCGVRM